MVSTELEDESLSFSTIFIDELKDKELTKSKVEPAMALIELFEGPWVTGSGKPKKNMLKDAAGTLVGAWTVCCSIG